MKRLISYTQFKIVFFFFVLQFLTGALNMSIEDIITLAGAMLMYLSMSVIEVNY